MDGYVTIGTELDTKEFDSQIKYIESKMNDIEDKLKQADMGFEVGDTQKLEAEYERLGNQLIGLRQKQEKYNQSIRESGMAGFINVKESIDGVGKSLTKITKKVVKWGLAVFSIRSAYMGLRNVINVIAGDDEQLKADIDYMKNALAYTLEPVVRAIVDLAKQLMVYLGYIINAWFGVNIFANANKGLNKAVGSAKELKKQLTGFDEMNVLSDNSSSGGGSAGVAPSFDLTAPENIEPPAWIKWIAENKDIVIAALTGIAAAILLIKLNVEGLMALGIGLIIAGIILLIQDIIDFINDPSWENFANILIDLSIILAGVAVAMLAVNAANPVAWIMLAIAAIVALVAAIIKYWDEIKEVLGKVGGWINDNIIKPVANFFVGLWNGIKNGVSGVWTSIKNVFGGIANWIKEKVVNPITGFFSGLWDGIKIGVQGLSDTMGSIFNTMVDIIKAPINLIIDGINKIIGGLNSLQIKIPDWVPGVGGQTWGVNIPKVPKLARGGIVNNPGPGVMMGNYIAGERGAEAVLPLTDDTLQRLANMIPITVNVTNTMNGRVISRELQRVQNVSDFAYNR